jgi:hypothetical protein
MKNINWIPPKREGKLTMANNWVSLIILNKAIWQIAEDKMEKLQATYEAANSLSLKPAGSRSPADNAELRAAINEMVACMRDIKKRYFYSPPLTEADFLRLGLKPKDVEPTSVPAPAGQAKVETRYAGPAQLEAIVSHVEGTAFDLKTIHGYQLAFMLCDADQTPPASGKEFTESKFSRRKKFPFTFEREDMGKKMYFAVRYENSKGEAGPWGPVTSAVVPF